jgi:PadR family transcriptional regulator PadR
MGEIRLTWPTLKLLKALLEDPTGDHYGLQLAKDAGLPTGTIYPVLIRLERAGWLTSWWEQADPTVEQRPRRRFYRLTPLGATNARRAFHALQPSHSPTWGRTPWSPPDPGSV